jgi:putative MATE family efflux protein
MVGQLGEVSVASVGLANQVSMLLFFMLFGITSGCAIFTAQYWGKQDVTSVRKVLGISLTMALTGSSVFTLIALLIPRTAISLYTSDPQVIALGSQYLRILGLNFIATSITLSFSAVARSVGQVRVPMLASMVALVFNTGMSYILIFGKLGMPALGALGIGWGTTLSRFVELGILLILLYSRRPPVAARPRDLIYDKQFFRRVISRALPVALNEFLWSLGVNMYILVYARISTEAVAAVNILGTIEGLAFTIFLGISEGCSILVGNRIGAGEEKTAYRYARNSILLATVGAILVGILLAALADPILSLYKVSPLVKEYAQRIFLAFGLTLWVRVSNLVIFVGILRSGGDTRFAFIVDASSVWFVGVPIALVAAFVFHQPVYIVYLMVALEEVVKYLIGLARFRSRKWINNVTQAAQTDAIQIT